MYVSLANLINIGRLYPPTIYIHITYMTRVWRLRFALCWFFVAIIVFIMRDLPALSMSVWICWAFVAVDTWNCCTRFAVFVSVFVYVSVLVLVLVFVSVSVLVVVVVIVDVALLLLFFLPCLYYVFHLLRPSHSLYLFPSLPLLLVLIIVVALSLAFGFRRFSCNLPGKLLSTWTTTTTTRFHFHSHSTIAFLLAWGSLPCPKNSVLPCGVMIEYCE